MALCEHLALIDAELHAQGLVETFRGQAWSANCREWVYFDAVLDLDDIRARHVLAPCVREHVNLDTHNGTERGLECSVHHDGIMGRLPDSMTR